MQKIGLLGINHKSASLELREAVAQSCHHCFSGDNIVLSTCHRTEVYFDQVTLKEEPSLFLSALKKKIPTFQKNAFYSYFGYECFYHLVCVTAGLDSPILAESDIQRQVKTAYTASSLQKKLSSILHYTFQKSLKLGKEIRSKFPLFQKPMHLEKSLYNIVESTLKTTRNLLFIGNSETNRRIIHYFKKKQTDTITLCTNNPINASHLARDYGISLKNRQELLSWHDYDGIIAATTSQNILLKKPKRPISCRLILDLSVPRIADPHLQQHPNLTLLNIENLEKFFQSAYAPESKEITDVKIFIERSIKRYIELYTKKRLEPLFNLKTPSLQITHHSH
jgi:glutamyl-tRNA reductase